MTGKRLMTAPDPLGPSAARHRVGSCEACGDRARAVATYQIPMGVFCAVVSGRCAAAGRPPPVGSWGQAVERAPPTAGTWASTLTRWPTSSKPNRQRWLVAEPPLLEPGGSP